MPAGSAVPLLRSLQPGGQPVVSAWTRTRPSRRARTRRPSGRFLYARPACFLQQDGVPSRARPFHVPHAHAAGVNHTPFGQAPGRQAAARHGGMRKSGCVRPKTPRAENGQSFRTVTISQATRPVLPDRDDFAGDAGGPFQPVAGWPVRRTGCWLNCPAPQRGQLRSSPAARLAASTGATSALSLAGLPMHAVPRAAAAGLSRSAGPGPSAGAVTVLPRRHAAAHGTRQACPQSRQTRSYSPGTQGRRTLPSSLAGPGPVQHCTSA